MNEYDGTEKRAPRNWLEYLPTAKDDFEPLKKKAGRPLGSKQKEGSKSLKKVSDDESICELVSMMSACGVTHVKMAKMLGIHPDTLRANFPDQLENGAECANLKVAQALFNKAVQGDVRAQIFWLTAKGNFIAKTALDVTTNTADTMSSTEKGQRLVSIMLKDPKFLEMFKKIGGKKLPPALRGPIDIN